MSDPTPLTAAALLRILRELDEGGALADCYSLGTGAPVPGLGTGDPDPEPPLDNWIRRWREAGYRLDDDAALADFDPGDVRSGDEHYFELTGDWDTVDHVVRDLGGALVAVVYEDGTGTWPARLTDVRVRRRQP